MKIIFGVVRGFRDYAQICGSCVGLRFERAFRVMPLGAGSKLRGAYGSSSALASELPKVNVGMC